jgi:hypothetical protein
VKRNSCSFFPSYHKTKEKNSRREKGSDPQVKKKKRKKRKKRKKKKERKNKEMEGP